MKISSIKQQLKNQRRYSIYMDEKYSFSLSETQLASSGLHIGQELSSEDIKSYKDESDLGKLYDRTLKWLAIRPRSAWEVDTYLRKITKKEDQVSEITKKLQKLDLVDDEAFARSWVESRRLLKAISRKKLWVELRQKRVSTDIIDQVLAEDETDELEVLKQLIERKGRQSQYRDRQRLLAYLARQGWRYDQIKQAFDELDLDIGTHNE